MHRWRVLEPRRFKVFEQPFAATFAAEAAFAIAAEAAGGVEQIRAVDPNHACFQLCGNVQRNVDALAPDAGSETVDGVIGELNGFARRAKGHGGEDGAENLLLGDDGAWMDIA